MGMQYSRGLVAGYSFENTGADVMGGTAMNITGGTFVDGIFGRALSNDGIDDFATFTDFVFSVGKSISMWVDLSQIQTTAYYYIIGNSASNIYGLAYNGSSFLVISGTSGYAVVNFAKPAGYIHLVVTRRTNNLYDIYVNTVLIGTANSNNTNTIIMNIIAGRPTTNYLKVIYDNIKLHSRILTKQDIQRDYLNLPIF